MPENLTKKTEKYNKNSPMTTKPKTDTNKRPNPNEIWNEIKKQNKLKGKR